jgi:hypothetical protein
LVFESKWTSCIADKAVQGRHPFFPAAAPGNEQQGSRWLTENVAFGPGTTDIETRLGYFLSYFASGIHVA